MTSRKASLCFASVCIDVNRNQVLDPYPMIIKVFSGNRATKPFCQCKLSWLLLHSLLAFCKGSTCWKVVNSRDKQQIPGCLQVAYFPSSLAQSSGLTSVTLIPAPWTRNEKNRQMESQRISKRKSPISFIKKTNQIFSNWSKYASLT